MYQSRKNINFVKNTFPSRFRQKSLSIYEFRLGKSKQMHTQKTSLRNQKCMKIVKKYCQSLRTSDVHSSGGNASNLLIFNIFRRIVLFDTKNLARVPKKRRGRAVFLPSSVSYSFVNVSIAIRIPSLNAYANIASSA